MQLQDDPKLLDLMLEDQRGADSLFRPGNYWMQREAPLIAALRARGLHDIRRSEEPLFRGFGIVDPGPGESGVQVTDWLRSTRKTRLLRRFPGVPTTARWFQDGLNSRFPTHLPYGITTERVRETAVEFCRLKGVEAGAPPPNELEISLAGNPGDVFTVDGHTYTMSMLYYYLRAAYCHRHTDLNAVKTVVELGCGSGKQVEVNKKLHPHLTYVLFDIVPQLYIAEQYLKAVFPDQVVSYRKTRDFTDLSKELHPGGIHLFGSWSFPLLAGWRHDLFWNAASFQEMEPELVNNYLSYVNGSARQVYLQEQFSGKPVAREKNRPGVLRPTVMSDYERGLPAFERREMTPCWTPTGLLREQDLYHDSWWERR